MEKIHILTDSSSDIPHDLVEAHGIELVPIMLTHEGRRFREYYDITSEEYCRPVSYTHLECAEWK